MLRVGATEAERAQVISRLRGGMSYEEATGPFRKLIEKDWFDANEEHLEKVAASEEPVPAATPHELPRELLDEKASKPAKSAAEKASKPAK